MILGAPCIKWSRCKNVARGLPDSHAKHESNPSFVSQCPRGTLAHPVGLGSSKDLPFATFEASAQGRNSKVQSRKTPSNDTRG